MKLLICLQHFLPGHVAGTEMYTLRLAQHLSKQGVEPVIVVPNFGKDITEAYMYEGIRVIRYAENSLEDRKMIMGQTQPEGIATFAETVLKEQPSVIHFHELTPGRGLGIYHVQKARALGFRVVLTFHLSDYTCIRGSLIYKDVQKCDGVIRINRCTSCFYQAKGLTGASATMVAAAAFGLYSLHINTSTLNSTLGTALGFPYVISKLKNDIGKLASLAEKIIVVADWYQEILVKNGVPEEKIEFIAQGLTNQVLTPSPVRDRQHLPLKLVFIGRISPLKGLHLLIEAISRLPEEQLSLHIYGQETMPGYTLECKQLAAGRSNIHWMGLLPSADSIRMLAQHDLLCLPSAFSEMSPLVIQEAFAAGLPVLASDVYGNAEQVKDGVNGWLFRFKDVDHLAEKLADLVANPQLLDEARKHLPVTTDFGKVAAQHARLYKEILQHQN